MFLLCSEVLPNPHTVGESRRRTPVSLLARSPWVQCSGKATSGAGFLLPMETSCSVRPCPNPPSAVTLKSLLAHLSVRISLWQIFMRGCFAGEAVSQGGWQGAHATEEALVGTGQGHSMAAGSLKPVGPLQLLRHPPV